MFSRFKYMYRHKWAPRDAFSRGQRCTSSLTLAKTCARTPPHILVYIMWRVVQWKLSSFSWIRFSEGELGGFAVACFLKVLDSKTFQVPGRASLFVRCKHYTISNIYIIYMKSNRIYSKSINVFKPRWRKFNVHI